MKCPYCGKELLPGQVRGQRSLVFSPEQKRPSLSSLLSDQDEFQDYTLLATGAFINMASAKAQHCPSCRKVIIEY